MHVAAKEDPAKRFKAKEVGEGAGEGAAGAAAVGAEAAARVTPFTVNSAAVAEECNGGSAAGREEGAAKKEA